MGQPITWQNVTDGGAASNASKPLYYAADSLNKGFSTLGNLIDGVTSNDNKNWIQQKSNNSQDFLDYLSSFKSPEELAAAQASGEIDARRQSYGAQINRDDVRNAQVNQMNTLRDAVTKGQAYTQQQNALSYEPLVNEFKAKVLAGDKAGANQIATNFPQMPQLADLLAFQRNTDHQTGDWEAADAKNTHEQAMYPDQEAKLKDELLNGPATRAAQAAQVQTNLMNARTSAQQAQNTADQQTAAKATARAAAARKQQDDAFELLQKNAGMSSGTLDTEEGKKAFVDGLKARNVSQNQASDILYNLNKYFSDGGIVVDKDAQGNPVKMPIPVSDALKAVEQSTDNPLALGFSRRGDDFANILQNRFGKYSAVLGSDNSANQDKSRINEIKAVLQATKTRLTPLSSSFGSQLYPPTTPRTVSNPLDNSDEVKKK